MVKTKRYENGLRVIVESYNYVRSVSMGIMVGTGSYCENEKENGISHFIEHVNFKGTKKRTAFEISDSIDGIGAQIDAFTGKDITCYYVKCTDEHIEDCFEILADLFCNSVYPENELDKERGVIIEEINMSEDSPDDLCLDLLAKSYFGDGGFGATILGSQENVTRFTREEIFDYKKKFYKPSNVVISFAGNISEDVAYSLVERYMQFSGKNEAVNFPSINDKCLCGNLAINKTIEQNHIAIGFPGVNVTSENRIALVCLNAVLGGGMSSRLFQSVREKLGLAYSVFSYMSSYKDLGTICVYAGVNPAKRETAYQCLLDEIKKFAENGVTEKELSRVKEQIKGSTVLSRENMSSIMISQGKRLLLTGKPFDIDKELQTVSDLSLDKVNKLAREYFSLNAYASAIVGKNVKPLR